jgi:endonuclease-3
MEKKFEKILSELKRLYPNNGTALKFGSNFQLAIAVILSAQCTDARVNSVTKVLFKKLKTPEDFANVSQKDLEKLIYSTGFYRAKAKNIRAMAKKIIENHGGKLPNSMEELVKLPGIGRKTANIILSEGFGLVEGIAVDTHVKRLSQRIGLSNNKTPEKIELDLMKIFPKSEWRFISNALILHGRKICSARKPKCQECSLNNVCKSAFKA